MVCPVLLVWSQSADGWQETPFRRVPFLSMIRRSEVVAVSLQPANTGCLICSLLRLQPDPHPFGWYAQYVRATFYALGRPFHVCRDEMKGRTGFDQGFKTVIVFRRPSSTLEARGRLHFFAFSPSSTRRRMASERVGSSACRDAQASTVVINSSERRIVRAGSTPVGFLPDPGRFPPLALRIAFFI
jgi:hypothetical protein